VYGLHNNAEIIYYRNYASQLWFDTLSMQTADASGGGGSNKEDFVTQVAGDIESSLPELFDIYNIRKKFEVPSPTQVVLMQELERFNILLSALSKSLADLQKALKGQIGFTADLDDLSSSIFNGYVPNKWKMRAP
jgi:dynein heavy chain